MLSTLINMKTTARTRGISASGLEDVVAAVTRLSDVDGEHGRLVIAGKRVEELAGEATFEEAAGRLLGRPLSSRDLGEAREAAFEQIAALGDALDLPDAMDALRAATAHLESGDAVRIIGAVPVFAAAWARAATPERPDAGASHAADYLRMATGRKPSAAQVRALDAYLVTVIDHGMNASTFAARVVASTASDTVSAIVAALGALKGKLHGGAPGPVLDMLDAVGDASNARTWIEAALARGERIMGMGHRVYRVRDPRAFVLERAIRELEASPRLALARSVEAEAETILAARHPDRPLKANVEFYTAVLLEAVGLPRALFTPTFAVGRVAGWCAHVEEQRLVGRLIRPQSRYIDVETSH
jgi:citrate synthase